MAHFTRAFHITNHVLIRHFTPRYDMLRFTMTYYIYNNMSYERITYHTDMQNDSLHVSS